MFINLETAPWHSYWRVGQDREQTGTQTPASSPRTSLFPHQESRQYGFLMPWKKQALGTLLSVSLPSYFIFLPVVTL